MPGSFVICGSRLRLLSGVSMVLYNGFRCVYVATKMGSFELLPTAQTLFHRQGSSKQEYYLCQSMVLFCYIPMM